MTLTADQRIVQMQAQASKEVGDRDSLQAGRVAVQASSVVSTAVAAKLAFSSGGALGVAMLGAGLAGGWAGSTLADKIGAADKVADVLENLGAHRVGQGGPHPATVDHQVAHANSVAGFLTSLIVGAAVGLAVGAAIVATGGAAAVVLIGAAAAGGSAGGFVGSALGGAVAQTGQRTGPIITGSPDVFIEGKAAARVTDTAACSKESTPQPIIEGSETIFINGLPLARIGHKLLCGAVVDQGAMSVWADNTTAAYAEPAPGVPAVLEIAAQWLGIVPFGRMMGRKAAKTTSAQAEGKAQAVRECASDPVDVASGEFVDWRTDIEVPGVLPLTLRRHYASRREPADDPGLFGPRWLDSWSVSLRRHGSGEGATIDYLDDEGVVYTFDTPFEKLDAEHLRAPHLVLRGTHQQPVLHDRKSGQRLHFAWQGEQAWLTAVSDASDNRIDFERDGHALSRIRHSDGWHVELHWQAGHLQSAWLHERGDDPVELVRYGHDARGRLTHCASDASGRLRYQYDAAHRITGWGDDSATRVQVHYEPSGRVERVVTPGNVHSGRFEYDPAARLTRVWEIGERGEGSRPSGCTIYHYNADELVTLIEDPLGHRTRTDWDVHHRVVARCDALGRRTEYRYDLAGRLVQVTDARGRLSEFAHDAEGRLTGMTDTAGRTAEWHYDTRGRLVTETDADGRSLHYDYDDRGRLRREWREGAQVEHHYDTRHRPCGHTAANGGHTAWRQDRLGRLEWQTDAAGATTTYGYEDIADDGDNAPRAGGHAQPSRIELADGGVVTQRFDREGLPSERTDASGHTRRWHWGAFDLLTMQVDETGQRTHYHYGAEGRLTELVNAAGQRWRWQYDPAGRLAEQIDYAGRRTRWERDAAGRPTVRIKPDGSRLSYLWDDADRVRAIDGGDTRQCYDYDAQDRLVRARVWRSSATCTALDSELTFAYDEAGRVVEETHRGERGPLRRIGYRYDALGRLEARDGPLGETRYVHDVLGLLRELHTGHGAIHIQRDLLGRETERASAQPATPKAHFRLQQRHDKLGRLIEQRAADVAHGPTVQRRYLWQHERLLGVDDARFGNVRWQLDARDQITEARYDALASLPDGNRALAHAGGTDHRESTTERFAYDALGNLARRGGHALPLRYAADTVVEYGDKRYTWDACGRLASRTETRHGFRPRTWSYEWDAFDRLRGAVTPQGALWHYSYDAFGRRRGKRCLKVNASVKASSPQATQRTLSHAEYLWDGPTLAAQWKVYADGTPENPAEEMQEWHFEPGGFVPLAVLQRRRGQTRMLHVISDLSGAPRELIANDGEVQWAAQLDTWGRLGKCHVRDLDQAYAARFAPGYRPAANDPVIEIDLRFANQWADDESGLCYNLNRYYDPELGQYASLDPLGLAGGIRTHGYVHNPATWVDPLGLAECPGADAAKSAVNWKSVKQFGHTFSEHGAGAKNTGRLLDRARSTGNPQGQWLNNETAAEALSAIKVDGPATIRIPQGLGQVIKPDGTIVSTEWATIVPRGDGLRTAYPIVGS